MRYAIGIDLGTTNSCCAYIDLESDLKKPELFPIEQAIEPGETAERLMLPSFIFLLDQVDMGAKTFALPWDKDLNYSVGELAKKSLIYYPQKVVSSSKSWLSNMKVDRKAPILPWNQVGSSDKISPFEAASKILTHIKNSWNYKMGGGTSAFENQEVTLTVPASFDDAGRELTVEAAEKAGIKNLTLLEEPQAAFYAWLLKNESLWKKELRGVKDVLVCDVGGGTTDFTIIRASSDDTGASLKRVAVGDHLLLGGDNMDMALALMTEKKYLGSSGKLDAVMWASLCAECRTAKEKLLADNPPEKVSVAILGRGSRIISSSISAEISFEDCESAVLEGFFPSLRFGDITPSVSSGLSEWGLPYQKDPRITRHMADFIKKHAEKEEIPDAVLFNGGVFRSALFRSRVKNQLEEWGGKPVKELQNDEFDAAVALGAAYFSKAKRGDGVRIGGGSPRSYYVKIDAGTTSGDNYLCLIPKDLMTENVQEIKNKTFLLSLEHPVSFSVFSSTSRDSDMPGDIISVNGDSLSPLPPLFTVLPRGEDKDKFKEVFLKSNLTEIGTLELKCSTLDNSGEWKLNFGVFREGGDKTDEQTLAVPVRSSIVNAELARESQSIIRLAFEKKNGEKYRKLLADLENLWQTGKKDWDISVNRLIFDSLIDISSKRRIDAKSEGAWFNAAGFTLRPGYGYPLDDWRIKKAESLIVKWLQFNKEEQNRLEWWIFWRRCAGGLSGEAQKLIFDRVSSWFLKGKKHLKSFSGPNPSKSELMEILQMASYFDKLSVSLKIELGGYVMKNILRKDPVQALNMIRRIAGRRTIYGNANFILPAEISEEWIREIISAEFSGNSAFMALSAMAELTGDRSRDVSEEVRNLVSSYLKKLEADDKFIKPLFEVAQETIEEEDVFLGDSIPPGLKLILER